MDIATVIGTLLAFGLVLSSMASGPGGLVIFIHVPSLMIVCGGTVAVVMMNFPMGDMKGLVSVIMRTYLFKLSTPAEEIERIIEYANLARKEGLLALEEKLKEVDDKFFGKGIQLVIDGFGADTVRDIMEIEAEGQRQRHSSGKSMLDACGSMAPAFGI